ncbi:MAG: PQQ-binding-like beta-propeller repeat protein [Planctomycetes bacterium]|nr:PQQ-binding-like beta-propeller repeat protein [Planctomycetota bacterium]
MRIFASALAALAPASLRADQQPLILDNPANCARYDDADVAYRDRIGRESDPSARAALAAEFAGLLERIGRIVEAIPYYELAVAEGVFDDWTARRLDARLQHCRRQRASRVTFPVSVEARDTIRQIEVLLETRQWTAALTAMQRLLERFAHTFLQREPGHFEGIWHWADQRLRGLPGSGETACIAFTEDAWTRARADGSPSAFQELIRNHPASRAADNAWLAWAETLADQGCLHRALGLIDRDTIPEKQRDQRRSSWLGLAGQATSSPATNLSPEDLVAALDNAPSIPLDAQEDPWTIGIAADNERVYVHRPFRVEAYDRSTARPLWQYRPAEPADRVNLLREVFRKQRRPKDPWTGAHDPLPVATSPAGVLIVETYHRGDVEHVYAAVTCLNPSTGRPVWTLAADPRLERLRACSDPVYAAGTVLFTAASRGEFPEFFVCAVDALDGHLLWQQPVAAAAVPTQCVGRGMIYAGRSGSTLAADGHVIHYATHMGALVAIDRDLGQLLWAITYPRVTRFGPLMHAPLTLLERRTEAMRITPSRIVLMPRDFNGLLVIDRKTASLTRTIPSADLVSLVQATDRHALVSTLAGDLRCCELDTGDWVWMWRGPGTPVGADHVEGQVLVTRGLTLTRLDAETGRELASHDMAEPATLRFMAPNKPVVAMRPGRIQFLTATGESPPPFPAPPLVLHSNGTAQGRENDKRWHHIAFIPGRQLEARFASRRNDKLVVVADATGLSGFDPSDDFTLRWWRPFDGRSGIWTASILNAEAPGPGIIAASTDREHLEIIDPDTGRPIARGPIDGLLPIRSLHAVANVVIATGANTLAGVTAADDGSLRTRWLHDLTPCVFEAIYPGDSATSILVQPGGDQPGRLLRIDTRSGKLSDTFIVAAPRPHMLEYQEQDRPDRYPVHQLSYAQSDLRRRDGLWSVSGANLSLDPCPVLAIARRENLILVDIVDYWGAVNLTTGEVTLLSPFALRSAKPGQSAAVDFLHDWRQQHPRYSRAEDIPLYFDEQGLALHRDLARLADYEQKPYASRLDASTGEQIRLGGIRPERIQLANDSALIQGERGIVILHRGVVDAPARHPSPERFGKDPATLFDPPVAGLPAVEDLQLDGQFTDWPEENWIEMSFLRHSMCYAHRATRLPRAGLTAGAPGEAPREFHARFQWARHDGAYWLAVEVHDDQHTAPSAAVTGCADRLEVLVSGCKPTGLPRDPRRDFAPAATLSLRLGDNVPIATVASSGQPLMHGIPVGFETAIDAWLARRYLLRPVIEDTVSAAVVRNEPYTRYELRLADGFFGPGGLEGFDLRIFDIDGAEQAGILEWGGALMDPGVCPLATLVPPDRR